MKDAIPPPPATHPAPFDAFKELAQRVLTVPKKEVDKKEAAYQRARAKKLPKRGSKPQK